MEKEIIVQARYGSIVQFKEDYIVKGRKRTLNNEWIPIAKEEYDTYISNLKQ